MNRVLKITAMVAMFGVALSGCTTVKGWMGKHNNGSLDYQSSKKLEPLQLPVNQETASFTPLYPTPNAKPSNLTLTNASGKQFEMPKPPTAK